MRRNNPRLTFSHPYPDLQRTAKEPFIESFLSKKINRLILLFITLTIPALFLFWKTLFPPFGYMIFGQDVHSWLYYVYNYMAKSIFKNGSIPYWNPYAMGGLPLLANPSGGSLFYPANIIFILLPPQYSFAVYQLIHIIFAGFAMYWYMSRHTDYFGAIGSSVLFAFSGFMVAQVAQGHPETIVAIGWLPIIIGATEMLMQREFRRGFLVGLSSLTLQILAGTHIVVLFSAELVFFLLLTKFISVWLPKKQWFNAWQSVFWIGLTWLISLGISAIELFPFIEYVSQSTRASGLEFDLASSMSFNWRFLHAFIGEPIVNGKSLGYEFMVHIGWTSAVLICLSVIYEMYLSIKTKKLNHLWLSIGAATLFFFFLSLGVNTPLYQFFYTVFPVYQFVRRPVRHLTIVAFLLPVILGFFLAKIKWRWIQCVVIFALLTELVIYARPHIGLYRMSNARDDQKLIRYIIDNVSTGRVYANIHSSKTNQLIIYDNAGAYYGFPIVNGYTPLILGRYNSFISLGKDPGEEQYYRNQVTRISSLNFGSQILDYVSTRLVIDAKPTTGQQPKAFIPDYFVKAYENYYATVWENPRALDRFFLVDDVRVYKSEEDRNRAIQNNEISLAISAGVLQQDLDAANMSENDVRFSECSSLDDLGSAQIRRYRQNELSVAVLAKCPSLLVTSEPYYPGWEAKIDGRNVPILIANVAFRSAIVPGGEHTVEFIYNPKIYRIGLAVSLISLVAAGIILLLLRAGRGHASTEPHAQARGTI